MAKILITDPVSEELIQILKSAGHKVDYLPDIDSSHLISIIENYDAIAVRSRTKVTRKVIDAGKKLRVIARVGVGLDNIDVKYAREKGITVINAGEATAQTVAELAMGLIIALVRKVYYGYRRLREGGWAKKECLGIELYGKTLGIIGAGNIGTRLGIIAHYGFGMRVLGYRRRLGLVKPPLIPALLDEILSESHIISIHLPLTEETKGFFGPEIFSKMRRGVYIVSTSRMEIINIDALIDALSNGIVAGFAADTNIKPDNPKISKLLSFDNVLLTPHIGAQTKEAQQRAARYIAQRIIEILEEN